MALFTKSVQLPKEIADGVRICIMRRPGEDVEWDIWMPHLAPSHEVLTARHQNTMTKPEFNSWFKKHVIEGQVEYLKMVVELARSRDITLLCWETDPNTCHRKLVAEACQAIDPDLSVTIR